MAVPILQGRLTKANEGMSEEQIAASLAAATARA
jgi:hypothetical protein